MNFVDTGPLLALHRRNDQYHADAVRLWPAVGVPAVTSNHVMDELATALGRLAGYAFAAGCVADLYASPAMTIIQATRGDEEEALQWMRKYAGQRVGFTDGVSFALMRRLGIRKAFSFDRRFRMAGFQVIGLK